MLKKTIALSVIARLLGQNVAFANLTSKTQLTLRQVQAQVKKIYLPYTTNMTLPAKKYSRP